MKQSVTANRAAGAQRARARRNARPLPKEQREVARRYSAPALEKGLDIIEFLARQGTPQSVRRIAEHLGRSKNQIFRMVSVLLSRGYIARNAGTEEIALTNQLFDLGMRTPWVRDLLEVAIPAMRDLTRETAQSAHLVVASRGETVVIAAIAGGSDVSFTLRLGYRRPLIDASSGRVILAFQPPNVVERWIEQSRPFVNRNFDYADLRTSIARIRQHGYEIHPSRDVVGISDVACPIRDAGGAAIAALVVPFVNRVSQRLSSDAVLQSVRRNAAAISAALYGPQVVEAAAGLALRPAPVVPASGGTAARNRTSGSV